MSLTTEESTVIQKTKELCQVLLDQPEFQSIRHRIDTFMTNEDAKTQFQNLNEKGEFLQHKQQQGLPLSEEEIAEFEKDRSALFENPVAKEFIEAQQEMHKVQESVGQYVAKTFELGRLPDSGDFEEGSCGPSCGCH